MIAEGHVLAKLAEQRRGQGAADARRPAAPPRPSHEEGIKTNVTLCFSPNQALLAAKVGATYISPFIGRLDDINLDGVELIEQIRQIYDNYSFTTRDPRGLDPLAQPRDRRWRSPAPTSPPSRRR